MIADLDMAQSIGTLPTTAILQSRSFSGPVFPLLKRFVEDEGMHCWINDGILNIASVYTPTVPAPKLLYSGVVVSVEVTSRDDALDVQMRTIAERNTVPDPFATFRPKKKKTRKKAAFTTYIDYDVVDIAIPGMEMELLAQPDIQPDDVVTITDSLDYMGKLFRVREVNHFGDNFGGDWTTQLSCDDFEAL